MDFTLGGSCDNRSPVNKTRLTKASEVSSRGSVMQRTGLVGLKCDLLLSGIDGDIEVSEEIAT
jgi:hypothetical protein